VIPSLFQVFTLFCSPHSHTYLPATLFICFRSAERLKHYIPHGLATSPVASTDPSPPSVSRVSLPPETQSRLDAAKSISTVAVTVSRALLDGATATARSLGRAIAAATRATGYGQSLEKGMSTPTGQAAKEIAVSALGAAGEIYVCVHCDSNFMHALHFACIHARVFYHVACLNIYIFCTRRYLGRSRKSRPDSCLQHRLRIEWPCCIFIWP